MQRGKYIVIEGIDGSGKSTQYERLAAYLGDDCVSVREPGGTPIAERIRSIIKDKHLSRSAHANMFLFSAARADLIDRVVRPSIEKGMHVISDRNWLSTLAYQVAEGADAEQILALSKVAAGEFFEPDITLLVDLDPTISRQRLKARGDSEVDFFDRKGEVYFQCVRQNYLVYAQKINGLHIINGRPKVEVVWKQIENTLKGAGL